MIRSITFLLAGLLCCSCRYDTVVVGLKICPPARGAFHGAYPDFGGTEDVVSGERIGNFENLAGKRIAWAYFSNNWQRQIRFPAEALQAIHEHGAVPFVRLMARTDFRGGADPVYTMAAILAGAFDAELSGWAQEVGRLDYPLLAEFGTEVNGDWFPWNGRWNGGGICDGYGDPAYPDGPERFRDAYRHIITLFRGQGVRNITWVFHVNAESWPPEPWNRMALYYPGDDFIDWIGISVYGAQSATDEWELFSTILDRAYGEFSSISANKPLAVLEFGTVEGPQANDKAEWIYDAFSAIRSGRYPRISAVSYWHESWSNDDGSVSNLRIDSSTQSLAAYRTAVADPFFIAEIDGEYQR